MHFVKQGSGLDWRVQQAARVRHPGRVRHDHKAPGRGDHRERHAGEQATTETMLCTLLPSSIALSRARACAAGHAVSTPCARRQVAACCWSISSLHAIRKAISSVCAGNVCAAYLHCPLLLMSLSTPCQALQGCDPGADMERCVPGAGEQAGWVAGRKRDAAERGPVHSRLLLHHCAGDARTPQPRQSAAA